MSPGRNEGREYTPNRWWRKRSRIVPAAWRAIPENGDNYLIRIDYFGTLKVKSEEGRPAWPLDTLQGGAYVSRPL
jgi:hypothetical protein